jgi:arginyl-tRNA synthetase
VEETAKYNTIGLGALNTLHFESRSKKTNPLTRGIRRFYGNTGPFIQYTYARIQPNSESWILILTVKPNVVELHLKEKNCWKQLELFPSDSKCSAAT